MIKVLLVEDDTNLSEIYKARLEAEGFQVLVAKDGEEGLLVAKANQPDLLISDVMMPRVSGMEMLEIIKSSNYLKNMKVIMLTALNQDTDEERAKGLGADKYLVKSQVTLEDIVQSVHDLLGDKGTSAAVETTAAPATSPAPEMPAAAPEVQPTMEPAMPAPSMSEPTMPASAPEVATDAPTDLGGRINHDDSNSASLDMNANVMPEPTMSSTPEVQPTIEPAMPAPAPEMPAPSMSEPTMPSPEMPLSPVSETTSVEMPTSTMPEPTMSSTPEVQPTMEPAMPAPSMSEPTMPSPEMPVSSTTEPITPPVMPDTSEQTNPPQPPVNPPNTPPLQ